MSILNTYYKIKELNPADAIEFISAKVNVGDLKILEGYADFDGLSDLSFSIFCLRCPK